MKSFFALVKLLFTQQFRSTSADKKKRTGTIIAFVVLGLCFAPMLVSLVVAIYSLGTIIGGNQGLVALLILVCQSLVLVLGLPSLIVGVFIPRDAEKLLYLPVKSSTIFLAKLTVAYINEVITTVVTILLLLVPYGIGANMTVGYYLMLLPSLLLIPMLPILLGTAIAMPFALILSKVGKTGLGKTITSIVFFVAFMAIYMTIMFGLMDLEASMPDGEITPEQLVAMIQGMVTQLSSKMVYVHPNYVLAGSITATGFVSWVTNFLLTLVEFGALATLCILIAQPFYKHMLAGEIEGGGSSGKKAKLTYDTKPTSIVKQLVLTDFKRTLRDSQMGFQSFVGIIMLPLLVVVFGTTLTETPMGETNFFSDPLYQLIAPVVLVAYFGLLGGGTNVLGLYPITRENNSFYILKSLPISFEKILMSKVLLSSIVMVAVYLLTTVIAVFTMKIWWYIAIGMMLVLTLTGFGTQCLTTRLDLKEPKFGWSNFNQSLKNSKNSWMAMLIGFIVIIVIGAIVTGFMLLYLATQSEVIILLMWLALTLASSLYAFVAYKILLSNSQKLFERIEA